MTRIKIEAVVTFGFLLLAVAGIVVACIYGMPILFAGLFLVLLHLFFRNRLRSWNRRIEEEGQRLQAEALKKAQANTDPSRVQKMTAFVEGQDKAKLN